LPAKDAKGREKKKQEKLFLFSRPFAYFAGIPILVRIAIVSESNRQIGGIETYLEAVAPRLLARGHDLAFFPGTDGGDLHRPAIHLPAEILRWPPAAGREAEALAALRAWRPDVLFAHTLHDQKLEAAVQRVAPTVFFAHAYYGTCLSGFKSHWFPAPRVCSRRLGPACLLHYFPHRCGGWNPLTALSLYRLQHERLRNLRACAALVVLSAHMAEEYRRHGFSTHVLPPWFEPDIDSDSDGPVEDEELRLLFLGRLQKLKGPQALLDALPRVAAALPARFARVRCTLAGTGEMEAALRARTAALSAGDARIRVEFPGWVDAAARQAFLRAAHLLVVPSLWPEPFGLVGLEAAAFGVPAVACNVGGVRDWLEDGVSGRLVSATPRALAAGIISAVRDPADYQRLRAGARARVARLDAPAHVIRLEEIFAAAAAGCAVASS